MATVSKNMADKIRASNGYYENDERVLRIVEYTDIGGKQAYGMEYDGQIGKYAESVYVHNPKIFWQVKD